MSSGPITLPMLPVIRDHLIINTVGMFVALVVVSLRVIGRFLGAGIGWDDGLVVLGYVCAVDS